MQTTKKGARSWTIIPFLAGGYCLFFAVTEASGEKRMTALLFFVGEVLLTVFLATDQPHGMNPTLKTIVAVALSAVALCAVVVLLFITAS